MERKISTTGKCLCGNIEIKASSMSKDLGVCHCGMCRRWSAGPFFAVECGIDIEIKGEEFLSVFDSSEWAQRAFCKNCGTNLFYKLKQNSQHIVSSELFNQPDLEFDHQIFIDEKPQYYEFLNKTKKMTGKEVFAEFSGEE